MKSQIEMLCRETGIIINGIHTSVQCLIQYVTCESCCTSVNCNFWRKIEKLLLKHGVMKRVEHDCIEWIQFDLIYSMFQLCSIFELKLIYRRFFCLVCVVFVDVYALVYNAGEGVSRPCSLQLDLTILVCFAKPTQTHTLTLANVF